MKKSNRGIDYFSRGVNKILGEIKALSLSQHQKEFDDQFYNQGFRFYLSKSAAKYKGVMEASVNKAKNSGLMEKLTRKYRGDTFAALNFDD